MENNLENAGKEKSFDLGQWLGRRQAFGLMASKSAAAEVECLRRIRDEKLYCAKGVDWAGFCEQFAGISSSYANRLIRQFEEFGPKYFDLSQILRISGDTYRQIAGAVTDDGIQYGGEKIAISPENSERIIEAVNALREQSGGAGESAPAVSGIQAARRRLAACVAELTRIFEAGVADGEREEFAKAISAGMEDLKLLALFMEG